MNRDFLSQLSPQWIEGLYATWQQDPGGVPDEWNRFFTGFSLGSETSTVSATPGDNVLSLKQSAVQSLLYRYRSIGHLLACTDPLSPCHHEHPLLSLAEFGLDQNDLDTTFTTRRYMKAHVTLRELLDTVRETYCREIGVEFMHMQNPAERQWLIDRMEPCHNRTSLNQGEKLAILEKLHQGTHFEAFLQRRFPGQKRFSLEGGEILLPTLHALTTACPAHDITDLVLGMSHRGRLNVLAHIFGKPYEQIFAEFKETIGFGFDGDGDVKYHKGYSTDLEMPGGNLHLTIAPNPSHLEAVNGVVEGKCRARQDRYGRTGPHQVLPLLIHGDAAFAGQGSIMEVLNMSRLDGYCTGGTIHLVLNNQIGFTTTPHDARSTTYATDVAKMLSCPIFHVQGEAPEAAVHAARLALEYRMAHGGDVVIELICYRRHGHNEGDEPAFTQPLMYQQIGQRPSLNRLYADSLAGEGFDPALLNTIEQAVRAALDGAASQEVQAPQIGFRRQWNGMDREYTAEQPDTTVAPDTLRNLAETLAKLPEGFTPHPKMHTLVTKRLAAIHADTGIDWGNAEILAYASLLQDGHPVRISGQDSRRGTFNHRHGVLHDIKTGSTWMPLEATAAHGATIQIWNSLLSEFGVLAFEYGYSLEAPETLVIWEAQFGDFANGAQVIIDQFIASGETKWNRASGLAMLLPHGYEGNGAEHSSARIERFLQLCAKENMVVVNPSTPAQMFHLLRRQVLSRFRKPLVVFTPKSLLRHPHCVSSLEELCSGEFRPVISDSTFPDTISKALLCSGKIYYELLAEREKLQRNDVCIIRIEQLYPLHLENSGIMPGEPLSDVPLFWVQEEPENMGAWRHISQHLTARSVPCGYLGRPADSAPAVGSHQLHESEQTAIIKTAFAD